MRQSRSEGWLSSAARGMRVSLCTTRASQTRAHMQQTKQRHSYRWWFNEYSGRCNNSRINGNSNNNHFLAQGAVGGREVRRDRVGRRGTV